MLVNHGSKVKQAASDDDLCWQLSTFKRDGNVSELLADPADDELIEAIARCRPEPSRKDLLDSSWKNS